MQLYNCVAAVLQNSTVYMKIKTVGGIKNALTMYFIAIVRCILHSITAVLGSHGGMNIWPHPPQRGNTCRTSSGSGQWSAYLIQCAVRLYIVSHVLCHMFIAVHVVK